MAGEIETNLRGPQAYDLARRAVQVMESHQVWPTPLNFELWLHYTGDPKSDLGKEIQRMIDAGEPFTEDVADALAAEYLPKVKLNEQIRDAGDQLSRELDAVSKAVQTAQKSHASYGDTLADAAKGLTGAGDAVKLGEMVETLSGATRRVQRENKALERRLKDSTSEVTRLREHLEQVRRDATTDALTNLANRKAFDDELDRACAEAEQSGRAARPGGYRYRPLQGLQRHLGPPDRRPGDPLRRQRDRPHGRHAPLRGPPWRRGIRGDLPRRSRPSRSVAPWRKSARKWRPAP